MGTEIPAVGQSALKVRWVSVGLESFVEPGREVSAAQAQWSSPLAWSGTRVPSRTRAAAVGSRDRRLPGTAVRCLRGQLLTGTYLETSFQQAQ